MSENINTTSAGSKVTVPVWFQEAQQRGLLPATAQWPDDQGRPWPVVLLTAFGAWIAGIPLLGMVVLMFGEMLFKSPLAALVVGGVLVFGALALLRSKELPLFVEQFSVPMLWAATATTAWGLQEFMGWPLTFVLLSLLVAGQAMLLPGPSRAWLRLLLGAACMVLLLLALSPWGWSWRYEQDGIALRLSPWMSVHVLAAAWLVWAWLKQRALAARTLPAWGLSLEPFALGWAVAVLGALVWISGQTFLVPVGPMGAGGDSGLVGEVAREFAPRGVGMRAAIAKVASCVLTALAVALLVQYFHQLRRAGAAALQVSSAAYAVGAVFVVLAWFMPTLGAALLIAAVALRTQRMRLAVLAAVVAVWIVGGFYYSLAWPLAQKAVVMALAGALLAAFAWWAQRSRTAAHVASTSSSGQSTRPWLKPALVLASAALTLLIANTSIWQKEQLIAQGKPVFVRLAPVDPRSLMQGDYMALRFDMPRINERSDETPTPDLSERLIRAQRPLAVGTLNTQGVATLTRIITPAEPRKADEIAIELTPKNGGWVLVSDAWFFAEGQAQRWERARYGEFRVTPDGRALLVGMADEALKPIKPD
jgi:uncharacterized membrane-anchored protein